MSLPDKLRRLIFNIKTDKNYQLGIMAIFLVLGAFFVWVGVWFNLNLKNQEETVVEQVDKQENINTNETVSTEIARRTDGVLVSEGEDNIYPLAVMIENLASDEVRPQFGLSKAQIVYELIVEGGITRFMAIFASEENMEQVGPVRSARPTYLEFVSEYKALYAHAGGSPESLAAIDGLGINDCSALGSESRFFWREASRFAPHNLFSSSELLTYALRDKGLLEKSATFDSWIFKEDDEELDIAEDEPVTNIAIDFSTPEYSVNWKYDTNLNLYFRQNGGEKHKDALTDQQLTAKNVIIQMVPVAIPAGENGRVNFDVNGKGNVYIFSNGNYIKGTWRKNGREDRTKFYDANNNEIPLSRGNIWIEILPVDKTFTTSN